MKVSKLVRIQLLSAVNPTVHIKLVLCHADLRTFHTAFMNVITCTTQDITLYINVVRAQHETQECNANST